MKPARWRKSKGHYWGKWELWRGDSWLAAITECRLRGGSSVYLWKLIGREAAGQEPNLAAAKKVAKYAFEHAEIQASIDELVAEHGGAS